MGLGVQIFMDLGVRRFPVQVYERPFVNPRPAGVACLRTHVRKPGLGRVVTGLVYRLSSHLRTCVRKCERNKCMYPYIPGNTGYVYVYVHVSVLTSAPKKACVRAATLVRNMKRRTNQCKNFEIVHNMPDLCITN